MEENVKKYLDLAGLGKFLEKLEAKFQAAGNYLISDDITLFPDKAEYDSESKKIIFKHGETPLEGMEIDAKNFVKDGMVENVEVKDGKLIITFNTEAGKESIEIEITEIFDAKDYYKKTEVYTKDEVDTKFETKENAEATYATKEEVEEGYQPKGNYALESALADFATKTELEDKADSATTLAGYGITDAKIEDGEITLGSNKIAPLTASDIEDMFKAITPDEIAQIFNKQD